MASHLLSAEELQGVPRLAKRGALLGEGSAWIWTQHHKWFSSLTPSADCVHPLTCLDVTATAVSATGFARGPQDVAWRTPGWQGRVADVITALEARLAVLEPYPETGTRPATDPREVLRRTSGYWGTKQEHMNCADDRQPGFPVPSRWVEALIKEIPDRVPGTEKIWDHPEGAEALWQLRAAGLSADDRWPTFLLSRPGSTSRRHQEAE